MRRNIKLQVIMAGEYKIPKGKKIDFSLDEDNRIYIASCDKAEFGIAEYMLKGGKEDLEMLGPEFSGIVVDIDSINCEMAVKVFRKKGLIWNPQVPWKP